LVEVVGEQLSRMEDDAEQLEKLSTHVEELVKDNGTKTAELQLHIIVVNSKEAIITKLEAESVAKDARITELQQKYDIDMSDATPSKRAKTATTVDVQESTKTVTFDLCILLAISNIYS
jgi:hypothetical protein